MDVSELEIKKGDRLPAKDCVYRHGLKEWHEKKNEFLPSLRFFALSPNDKIEGYKLSVDWNAITSPEEVIARVGATYKVNKNGDFTFKEFENRVIYSVEINFLNSLNFILNVVYDPIVNKPIIIGSPNNPSHSLICFDSQFYTDQNEPMILAEIRNHAKSNRITVDFDIVKKLVEEYRGK